MLDVAVSGTIFASPSPSQIYAALRDLERRRKGGKGGKGGAEPHSVVMVLMNYTGDVMNFGLAAEKAQAKGMRVDMVVVRDDVGVGREKGGKVGRRGIAGTVLVLKIAGAMAEEGYVVISGGVICWGTSMLTGLEVDVDMRRSNGWRS